MQTREGRGVTHHGGRHSAEISGGLAPLGAETLSFSHFPHHRTTDTWLSTPAGLRRTSLEAQAFESDLLANRWTYRPASYATSIKCRDSFPDPVRHRFSLSSNPSCVFHHGRKELRVRRLSLTHPMRCSGYIRSPKLFPSRHR
jgi:hypothetical protein